MRRPREIESNLGRRLAHGCPVRSSARDQRAAAGVRSRHAHAAAAGTPASVSVARTFNEQCDMCRRPRRPIGFDVDPSAGAPRGRPAGDLPTVRHRCLERAPLAAGAVQPKVATPSEGDGDARVRSRRSAAAAEPSRSACPPARARVPTDAGRRRDRRTWRQHASVDDRAACRRPAARRIAGSNREHAPSNSACAPSAAPPAAP